jgi:alpha-tubulin suppressor-like RCC1 family protein
VPGLTGVIAVAPGSDHVCAIKSDRTVACWGNAGSGQLGNRVVDDRGPAFVRLTCQGD